MKRLLTSAAFAALVALACAGCGVGNPYETEASSTTASRPTLPKPPPDGEFPGRLPASERPPASPRQVIRGTPAAAARSAASVASNWTGATAWRAYSRLAAVSVGEARAEFEEIAARSRTDVEQILGYSTSKATVEGVVVKGTGGVRHAVIVVRQRISTPELRHLPAEYRVTLAMLRHFPGGWAISSWEQEP